MWRESAACTLDRPAGLTPPRAAARNGSWKSPFLARVPGDFMRDFMAVTKALADENRVRMLLALRRRELCVCQIIELIKLAPSTVSKHMSILKQSRLVDSRKEGRWMYYRLAGPDAPPAVRQAIDWAARSLAGDPQVAADAERLQAILRIDPEELCDRQCGPRAKCGTRRPAAGRARR